MNLLVAALASNVPRNNKLHFKLHYVPHNNKLQLHQTKPNQTKQAGQAVSAGLRLHPASPPSQQQQQQQQQQPV